jgi:hypothetical protein
VTSDIDDLDDEILNMDEAEIRQEVLRRARSEGALVAYESALEIAGDKKAPAVARASSQRTLLALAGLMDKAGRDGAEGKAPSELSPEELAESLAKLKGELASRERRGSGNRRPAKAKAPSADGGVFD